MPRSARERAGIDKWGRGVIVWRRAKLKLLECRVRCECARSLEAESWFVVEDCRCGREWMADGPGRDTVCIPTAGRGWWE